MDEFKTINGIEEIEGGSAHDAPSMELGSRN